MAKKSARINVGLVCSVCSSSNYTTEKNKMKTTTALKLSKFCSNCTKKTEHKEKKKLH